MSLSKKTRQELLIACAFFALAVMLGAFGAHGLKARISTKALETYQTGVHYQFLHAIALFITSFIGYLYKIELKGSFWAFTVGIFLFSFNCYLYAISGVKTFAMIVPIGGVLFLIGWFALFFKIYKSETL